MQSWCVSSAVVIFKIKRQKRGRDNSGVTFSFRFIERYKTSVKKWVFRMGGESSGSSVLPPVLFLFQAPNKGNNSWEANCALCDSLVGQMFLPDPYVPVRWYISYFGYRKISWSIQYTYVCYRPMREKFFPLCSASINKFYYEIKYSKILFLCSK